MRILIAYAAPSVSEGVIKNTLLLTWVWMVHDWSTLSFFSCGLLQSLWLGWTSMQRQRSHFNQRFQMNDWFMLIWMVSHKERQELVGLISGTPSLPPAPSFHLPPSTCSIILLPLLSEETRMSRSSLHHQSPARNQEAGPTIIRLWLCSKWGSHFYLRVTLGTNFGGSQGSTVVTCVGKQHG